MPEKKNQHFVPRFYLKYFSHEYQGKFLSLFNIPSRKFIERAALNGQASKNYFYGKDLTIENALGDIEKETSKLFSLMIETQITPPSHSPAHLILLTFITTLSARTEFAGESINETVDKFTKEVLKYEKQFKDELNGVSFGYENPVLLSLHVAAKAIPLLLDLDFKFIVNSTHIPFITSDNPVIKYNQFFERLNKPGGHTGYATKGLQMLFPIFPDLYVIFYDRDVYRVGNKKDTVVILNDVSDVEQLNLLQYMNAFENIYFDENFKIRSLDRLKEKGDHFRREHLSNVKEYFGEESSLLHIFSNDIKVGLKISFIQELKKAKKYDLGIKMVHYRNEELLNIVQGEDSKDL
ncbi:DUF4238 domain-containing protein [Paenibacillus vandeheii]